MIEDRMFPMLGNLLTLTTKRQEALASNIANIDTPGYRATDYSFEAVLDSVRISTTSAKHITEAPDSPSSIRMFEAGTVEKPNGNTVDLERELTEITKNGLHYLTLVQYLNHKLKTLRSSISEAGKV